MDHFVGRLLGKRDASRNGEPIEQAAPAVEPDSIDHALFNAYSVQPGSDAVSSEAEKRTEQSEAEPTDESEVAVAAGGEAHAIGGAGDYTQVGEHVAAVLTSAREGAAQLLAEARAHGERIGAEAEARAEDTISAARNEADGVRDEAARIRSQAEAYSEETRASAETYADASRRDADDERTKTLADAEQKAREIRAEAERRARAFGTEARQRHEALARNVDRSEERVQELVKVFRAMTGQLEALVETDAETETAANVEAQSNGAIDDALKLKRSTRADRNSNVAAGGTEDRRNAR